MRLNLKSRFGQATRSALRDRSVVALALTVAAVGGIFLVRCRSKPTMTPDQYWAMKASWRNCADVVLTGDSRVNIGANPQAMRPALPGRTILNFGFFGNGYTADYLHRARGVLRQDGSRIIVLGITPISLTSHTQSDNNFVQAMKDFEAQKKRWAAVTDLLAWLRVPAPPLTIEKAFRVSDDLQAEIDVLAEPMTFENAVNSMVHWNKRSHTNDYRPDGWMEVQSTRDDYRAELNDYEAMFKSDKTQPAVIDGLLKQVRQWRKEGVRVYAFRVPTSDEMFALENRISGFDEQAFTAGLKDAGGVWIAMDQRAYHSYDGSHLRYDAAIRMSQDLAAKIAAAEAAPGR